MRILYATDGSNGAMVAARLLAGLPVGSDSQVTILTVVEPGEEARAELALESAREALARSAASLTIEARRGHPAEAILQAAEEHAVDLVVVGWSGLSAIARFLLGSVAERVVRHAHCPVLVARPAEGELRRVVLGVDGSPNADYAAEWLRRFPLPADCEVGIVTVLPFMEDMIRARRLQPPVPVSDEETRTFVERECQEAQKQLDGVAASFAAAGRQAATSLLFGDPADAILQAAADRGAGLIVVGSQGLGAIERFVMGSVSERVVRYAPCSVLVVKRPQ